MSNDDSDVQPHAQEEPEPTPAPVPSEQPPSVPPPYVPPAAQQSGPMPPPYVPPGTPSGPPPGVYPPGSFQAAPQPVTAANNNDGLYAAIAAGLGLFVCGPLVSFVAIYLGNRVRKDDTDPNQTMGTAAYWVGIATVVAWVAVAVAFVIFAIIIGANASVTTG